MADIFDDDFFSDKKTISATKESAEDLELNKADIVESVGNGFDKVENSSSDDLPILVGDNYPDGFKDVVKRFLKIYSTLPKINYDDIHEEVANLNVESNPTPTLQLINLKLQKVQASKDRLSEIHQMVVRCYTFKKRAVSILTEAWGKFADGSSQDKRKADCAFRLSDFNMDLAQIEALNNVCDNVLRNLDSQSNAISRQITIIQSELKMFDMGRGSLPDFDFNKGSLHDGFESIGNPVDKEDKDDEEKNVEDGNASIEAEELSF